MGVCDMHAMTCPKLHRDISQRRAPRYASKAHLEAKAHPKKNPLGTLRRCAVSAGGFLFREGALRARCRNPAVCSRAAASALRRGVQGVPGKLCDGRVPGAGAPGLEPRNRNPETGIPELEPQNWSPRTGAPELESRNWNPGTGNPRTGLRCWKISLRRGLPWPLRRRSCARRPTAAA